MYLYNVDIVILNFISNPDIKLSIILKHGYNWDVDNM